MNSNDFGVRVVGLLKLARCTVVGQVRVGNCLCVDVETFSPMGKEMLLCCSLDTSQEDVRADSQLLASYLADRNKKSIIYVLNVADECIVAQFKDHVSIVHIESVRRALLDSARGAYLNTISSLLDERVGPDKILRVKSNGKQFDSCGRVYELKSDDALRLLQQIFSENKSHFCCLLGGFGTGKTSLLLALTKSLILPLDNTADRRLFPLYVNVAGYGSNGLQRAVRAALLKLFNVSVEMSLEEISAALGMNHELVLLIDSLDEQYELDSQEVGRLMDELVACARSGFKVVTAFRPELVEGSHELVSLLYQRVLDGSEGKSLYELLLVGLNPVDVEKSLEKLSRIDGDSAAQIANVAKRLAARALWHTYFYEYYGTSDDKSITGIIQYCMAKWFIREARISRPLIDERKRTLILVLLAYAIHTRRGIIVTRVGTVHRTELARFCRRIIPILDKINASHAELLKWSILPPELLAECLAIANLLGTDDEGYLGFRDTPVDDSVDGAPIGGVFLHYFLALGEAFLLSDQRRGWLHALAHEDIFNLFSIDRPMDYLGISRMPNQPFRNFLRELLLGGDGHAGQANKLQEQYERLLSEIRYDEQHQGLSMQDLMVVVTNRSKFDEQGFSYELKVPKAWPRHAGWYSAVNVIHLASLRQEEYIAIGVNFSFVSFRGQILSGVEFRRCSFIGAAFSYTRLTGVEFDNCDLDYALFFQNDLGEEVRLRSCQMDRIAHLHRIQGVLVQDRARFR